MFSFASDVQPLLVDTGGLTRESLPPSSVIFGVHPRASQVCLQRGLNGACSKFGVGEAADEVNGSDSILLLLPPSNIHTFERTQASEQTQAGSFSVSLSVGGGPTTTHQRRFPHSLLPACGTLKMPVFGVCAWLFFFDEGGERCKQGTGARGTGERVDGHPQEEVSGWGRKAAGREECVL